MLIDLQIHSTYSDGFLTPEKLASFLKQQGIKVASLTDHNTVGGLARFKEACKKKKIKTIPGMELYVSYKRKRVNMIWYNFNEDDAEVHKVLRNSHTRRRGSVRRILEKLQGQGFTINIDKILDKYIRYIPINYIVQDLWSVPANRAKIKKELNKKTIREEDIVYAYFKNPAIGKLTETYISLAKILKLREKAGGQIVLNHPAKHGYINENFWGDLKKVGIDGVEILSPHHSVGAIMYIQDLAAKFDFIETGGSDFHRHEGDNYLIQNSSQYFKIDSKYLRKIDQIIG